MNVQQQLAAIVKRSVEKAEKVVRSSVFEVGNRIVTRSPVDTGLFRASWLTGVDGLENKGTGAINQNAPNLKIGQTLYFTNNLPYAKKLEDGSSEQAPVGMVKISVAEFDSIAERVIRQLRD